MNNVAPGSAGSVITGQWQAVDERRFELGEGARFLPSVTFGDGGDPGAGFVCVDLLRGQLWSTTGAPDGGLTQRADLDQPLGALAQVRGDEQAWIGAVGEGFARLRSDGGRLAVTEVLATPAAGRGAALRMNDAVADPQGRFWAGAMAYDGARGQGFLARADPDGGVQVVLESLSIPNGPAFSADGTTMYLADTPTGWIRRYRVDPATGELGAAEDFVHVSEGGPDGMTVDAQGCLWSAIWGASCLHRYSPQGELVERIPVPVRQPTSVALSTEAPYRAVVTSATIGLDETGEHDGRVITAASTVAGIPAAAFG
ncbi:SMP-30/gluconolactonase/LRE family protein [Pseudactinotalea sp. Z1748]|uniref:SMP-30/gluconolactonase/LRE family protein n=1 Tax=Pseudactinotalea sp. Z1748 TaxID=3413027 RepID=UPI003C7B70E0